MGATGVRTLPAIGRRLLTDRRGQAALTVAGVVLGVALFTGCLLTTITATQGFGEFADETRGRADVVASAPGGALRSVAAPLGGELDGAVAATLAALPGVAQVDPLLVVPSAFEGPTGSTEQRVNFRVAASLVGIDLAGAGGLYPLELAEGRFPVAGAEEIVLPQAVARDLGATVGAPLDVSGPDGRHPFTTVGLLADVGLGGLDRIGFSSLTTVQQLRGRPGAVTQVAIALDGDQSASAWIDAHGDAVPPGVDLTDASDALRFYRMQLNALSGALTVLGAGLLLTAGFLIYLTLSMSVAERTRLYGTLRALGATAGQVRRVVYGEALAIGALGTALGLVAGLGVALALRVATARLMSLFGGADLVVSPIAFVVGAVVGLSVSLASALVPARRAARIDPAAAVRATAADPAGPTRRPGAIALAVGGLALLQVHELPAVYLGMLLLGIGVVRLVPVLIRPLSAMVAPAIARASRVGGRVAVQHLAAERTRSANTLALVMLVMAMTVAILAIYASFTRSLDHQLRVSLRDNLTVASAATFDDAFVDALAAVPGVAALTAQGSGTTAFHPAGAPAEDVLVAVIDPATYFAVGTFPFLEGTAASVRTALREDRTVVVPAGLADRHDLHVGDVMPLRTAVGTQPFTVVGVAEMSNLPAEIVVGTAAGPAMGATGIEDVVVRPAEGVAPEVLRDRIESALGERAQFKVITAAEYRADTRGQIGGGINSFFVLLGLAAVVGTFGLANTMAVAVTQRVQEIAVLRAIGARRRHIRAMAAAESLTLVAIALVLALPLGLVLAAPLMETTRSQLGDLTVRFQVPWSVVPVMATVAALVAFGAAVWPARRAAHIEIDEALRFE